MSATEAKQFTIPKASGKTPSPPEPELYTVTQLRSIPVTQFFPRGRGAGEGVEIKSALPLTSVEAEQLDACYGGPIWRLVGNVMKYEDQHGPLSEYEMSDLLLRYGQAYRHLCEQDGLKSVSQSGIEDAFYEQRQVRRVPTGKSPVAWALKMARAGLLPPEAAIYADDEARRLLVGICSKLASINSEKGIFFLSCRDLEEHVGIYSHTHWSALLRQMCIGRPGRPAILEEVEKGKMLASGRSKASVYRFLGALR